MTLKNSKGIVFKTLSVVISVVMTLESAAAYAMDVLPAAVSATASPSAVFGRPCNHLLPQGLTLDPSQPFRFDLMVHAPEETLSEAEIESESQKLIKYFLASVAVPGEDLWVNLSPQERGRMLTERFSRTDMGKDLLIQDYVLKSLSTQATNPESDIGRRFWDELYRRIYETHGSIDLPVESFQRVWIVPASADVTVNERSAFITDARLKVMLEGDYMGNGEQGSGDEKNLIPNPQPPTKSTSPSCARRSFRISKSASTKAKSSSIFARFIRR